MYLVGDSFHVIFDLVLPVSYDLPAVRSKQGVDLSVALAVAL